MCNISNKYHPCSPEGLLGIPNWQLTNPNITFHGTKGGELLHNFYAHLKELNYFQALRPIYILTDAGLKQNYGASSYE